MFSKRQTALLGELAKGFNEGTCLLNSSEWLRDNNVSLDECMALSSAIALCINAVTKTKSKQIQNALLISAVTDY